ncbi:hypothetical protein [Burkholderia ubonensis]|uniref:hypothetical protein n=1 Tax=Burkholderia ubonensis TaxID=101571 RepID=UPI000755373D|nr:hypothetical protein [Burkholderia ubonensis]KVV07419.1 hypothetical protein WK77_16665 [Burkholderia ubonensis]
MKTADEINAILEPETGWRVEVAVSPHDQSEFLRLHRKAGGGWERKEFVASLPRESPVGVIVACGMVAGHYFALGLAFAEWMASVHDEAKRILNRPAGDVTWLIGGPEDMRESFSDGMSPAEYVQAEVEDID